MQADRDVRARVGEVVHVVRAEREHLARADVPAPHEALGGAIRVRLDEPAHHHAERDGRTAVVVEIDALSAVPAEQPDVVVGVAVQACVPPPVRVRRGQRAPPVRERRQPPGDGRELGRVECRSGNVERGHARDHTDQFPT